MQNSGLMDKMEATRTFLFFLVLRRSVSSLELTGPSVHAARLGSDARVPCWFTVEKPPVDLNHLTIFWYFRDKEILSYNKTVRTTSPRYSLSTVSLLTGVANLTTSNIQIPNGGMYKCSVIYGTEMKEKEVRLDIGAPPQVTVTDKMAVVNAESVLRCSATGFYPVDIDVKWFKDEEKLNNISTEDPRRNPDRTYSVNSAVTITPTEEDRKRIFSCRVYHDFLQVPVKEDFHLVYGAPPQVAITDKMAVVNVESVLRCSATGFFPPDIDIKWFRDGEKLDNIIVGDPWRNPDRTYSVNSTVTITPTEEDRERIFSCRVQHKYLQEPLQKDFRLVYEDRSSAGIIATCSVLVVVILIIIIIAAVLCWRWKPRGNAPLIVIDITDPPKLIDGEEAALYCTVDNAPEDLTVTWLIRRDGREQKIQTSQMRGQSDEEVESLLDTSYVVKSQREGSQYLSSLSFIPHMERHEDVTFICRGVSGKHEAEKTFQCKTIFGKPKMSQPIMKSLFVCREMKYLLNLEKFYPKSIKIVWTCGERGTEDVVLSTDSILEYSNRSYNVSSEVIIPEDRLKNPGFRVRVTWEHESMEKPESQELSIRDSDYRWIPVVGEIQVPRLLLGSPAVLQCDISGYFPDAVTVTWMRRDGDNSHEETDDNQRITSRRAADNTYSRTASLTITPDLWTHQGAEYICLVEHPSLETPIERSTGRLQVYGKPQMSAPIEITMADSSRVQFSLNLQKFYPKDIKISWCRDPTYSKFSLQAKEAISIQDNKLTYEVSSVVQVPVQPYTDPQMKITVEWQHESLETPETRSLSVRDFPWRPQVGSINVPELEDGKAAILTCDISGYFPDLLYVSWFSKKDGNVTALPRKSSNAYRTSKMPQKGKKQADNTYSYKASLTFSPLISLDQGSEILCRVEHPSEERPIEQSTGPLHISRLRVGSINVPKLEVGKEAIFTCDISGYFLDLLSVTWFMKKDGYETTLPRDPSKMDRTCKMPQKEMKQKDKIYSYKASVTFTPIISSDEGSEILCRVKYPSEQRPIERSTGPLHIIERRTGFLHIGERNTFLGLFQSSRKELVTSGTNNNGIEEGEEALENMSTEPQEETKNPT